ncbi:MAG: diadenosine tetraphosphatase [Bacteroidetes bacterium]|nr:MAG: diadenosine tetraphosphatase [Bacteroidota bacterium]PTM14976.1 MAG: diadenosine tetraphosphatase [Bacteroidota bacterium]
METPVVSKNIGTLNGPLLVFGGVYSNLQALQALQALVQARGIPAHHIICTGDVVGYCADPEAVVQLVKAWGIHCIAGNVELQLRAGEADCGCDFNTGSRCDIFSRQWYPYAQQALSPDAIRWMADLPHHLRFQFAGLDGIVLHGSAHEVAGYVFASTPWAVKVQNFADTQTDLILAGHCGLPFSQHQGGQYWLNAGVIGMPANDGTPRVWYLIIDQDEQGQLRYTHHYFEYDHPAAAAKMRTHRLPEAYARTLETGLWDNCEILPEEETLAQGVALALV